VFIALWRSAARFDPSKGSETTFVGTIARRRVVDRLRRRMSRPETEQIPDEVLEADMPPVSRSLEINEEAGRARRALETLPEQRRKVLEMAVLEGETHVSIAQSTGIPLGTVKTHVRRGLIRLREMLGEPSGDDGD
jgi:RNA polymerase sigma-70 factor (ECF subfamily)